MPFECEGKSVGDSPGAILRMALGLPLSLLQLYVGSLSFSCLDEMEETGVRSPGSGVMRKSGGG